MTNSNTQTLDEFLSTYHHPDRQVIDLEIESQGPDYKSPFIVVRYGKFAILLNPMGLGDHLDVDAHSYVDGQSATTGSFGMTSGRRDRSEPTGTTSHGWPSSGMIALLVGEQAEVESNGEES
jgi:hypothetical protein